jgi:anti-sigma B factor antagonist
MEIEEKQVDGVTVLVLKGRMLIGEGTELLRENFERLVNAGHKEVFLDLGGVPYLDSAGLGEIVRCYKTLSRMEGRFKLLNVPKRINDLLTTARLQVVIGE